jgi:hypothetical protein
VLLFSCRLGAFAVKNPALSQRNALATAATLDPFAPYPVTSFARSR